MELPAFILASLEFCPLIFGLCFGCFGASADCNTCTIFPDEFDDSTITGWTQTAGSWSESGTLISVSSASAKLTCDTPNPDNAYSTIVVSCKSTANDDTIRITLGGNYAELIIGTNKTLKIFSSGGTPLASIASTTTAGSLLPLTVCLHLNNNMAAAVTGGATVSADVTPTDNYAAIGTGGTVTGTVSFDSFALTKINENCNDCPPPPCGMCDAGTIPEYMILTVPTISNHGCNGSDCVNVSGTFYLASNNSVGQNLLTGCVYQSAVISACGNANLRWRVGLGRSGGGPFQYTRSITIVGQNPGPVPVPGEYVNVLYEEATASTSPLDCSTLVTVPIKHTANENITCTFPSSVTVEGF